MKSVDVGGEEPSKAELVRMVSQFLLQNGMPVTAAALQKECEKLLLAKSSGASSNGGNKTARGRQQQRQESERCLADRLLDGKRAAQQQNMPPSPPSTTTIPMEPTAIKSPRHSPAISADRQSPRRKGASSQPAGQRKARSGPAARHPPVSGRQIQPAPHSSTHGGRSQRSTSQKPSANGGGITDMEPESCWPDEQRSAKLGRKADSTGNIAAPPTQTPPPADPVQARPSATVKPNTWTEELPLVAEQEQQEVNEQSRWLCTHLDFASIAQTLTKAGPGREAALLVQAIRQQLTKAGSLADGEANLRAFVAKDVLQLHNRKQPLTSLLLTDASTLPELKEQLARLLNAMASFRRGRDYLLSVGHGRQLFYEACTALKSRRLVGHAVDQLLATLQKLSIRPAAQKELLLNGLLEWLALALPQPRLGPAVLEFGAALLHNLTLNPLAQSSVLRHKDSLLAGLHWLIGQTRNGQVLHYACATLFTLLGQVRVRQSARERGDLERVINERLQRADQQQQQQPQQQQRAGDEQRQQLMALNLILRGELEPERRKPTDGREDNEDLFPDYLEAEIDSTDPLVPAFSELFGHTLLAQKFLLPDAPVPPPKRVQLVQFAIEWEQESSVPGVVPRRLRQSNSRPPKANETSSPQRKQKQPGKTNLSGANGHHQPLIANGSQSAPPKDGSPAVLAICRQVHFERTNSMSSLATFVVENNNRRPLLAFNGFVNVLASLKSGPSQAKGEKAMALTQPRKRAGGDAENSSSSETLVLEEAPSRQQKMPTNRQMPATTAKQNQQRHPNRVPEAHAQEASRRTATEVAKLFSSKLRTQQRGKWPRQEKMQQQQQHQQMAKQQKNGETSASATMLDGEELIRSATFGGREMSEDIEERQPSFDDEYLAAFAARPKVIRTPPAEE